MESAKVSRMGDPVANRRLRVMTMADGLLGGAEDLARQVAQRIDRERFESTLCVTRWEATAEAKAVVAELERSGTGFVGMRRNSRFDPRPWLHLVKRMRELQIDILHTHKIGSNLWGSLIAPRVPVPVFIAHEHTWSWEGQPVRKLIDRRMIAPRAAAFVAVSQADRANMTAIEGIPPEKTRFIPNGIPPQRRLRSGVDMRAELGVGADQPLVGAVGTLRPQKAYEVMIEAARELKPEFPDLRLVIVGGEENATTTERQRLEALVRERGLDGTVSLLGFRPDTYDLIEAFDVAAQSSDFEGSPLSVLEFMEAGKAVVATAVGGVPDQVHDGENGILVEPRNPTALAAGIAELLRDPARAAAMGRAGREIRRREFSMEAMISRVEDLYEELYAQATTRTEASLRRQT
jgi:glycosyltransferase involved in cell wall biosynthesis